MIPYILTGVDNVEIDMSMQKVTVTGWADQKKILKTVRKTGRRAELWQFPFNPVLRNHNFTIHNQQNNGGACGGPTTYYATSQPPAASSYNYYKHGYDHNQDYTSMNYYSSHQYGQSTIFGSRVADAFSEESVHGCSIM